MLGKNDRAVGRAHHELSGPHVALVRRRRHAVGVAQMPTAQPPTSFESLILKTSQPTLALRKAPPRLPRNPASGAGRAEGPARPRSRWGGARSRFAARVWGSGSGC